MIAYIALSAYGDGALGILYAIALLMGVYFCVTLHEYGHVLAARRFGIGTVDITLLPIGGVARLKSMPRIPWQELVVAVAGPAVNVVIVILLLAGFFAFSSESVLYAFQGSIISAISGQNMDEEMLQTMDRILMRPSFTGYALMLVGVNFMLVVFNMLPAFPMDGGRVFRSLLAMVINYRKATWIASRVGLLCAAGMAFIALNATPILWIPVLIAIFIGYAGLAEAKQVDTMEVVRGVTVRQAMIKTGVCVQMDTPLSQASQVWETSPIQALPVVSNHGIVVGMLQLRDVQQAMASGKDPLTPASDLIDHKNYLGEVGIDDQLETAIQHGSRQIRQIPVVDVNRCLVGILDLDSMLMRAKLALYDSEHSQNEVTFPPSSVMQSDTPVQSSTSNLPHGFNHFDQTN